MTVLEQRKYRLIRAIMEDTNESRVLEIEEVYYNNNNPLLYSLDELNERIQQFEQDEADGKMKYYTSEQLRKHVV